MSPSECRWREPPYEYEHTRQPIDILAGSDQLRRQIEAGVPAVEIAESWQPRIQQFDQARRRVLMY